MDNFVENISMPHNKLILSRYDVFITLCFLNKKGENKILLIIYSSYYLMWIKKFSEDAYWTKTHRISSSGVKQITRIFSQYQCIIKLFLKNY